MPTYDIWALSADQITVLDSGGGAQSLSGGNQGAGSHLSGSTIRLNSASFQAISITDNGGSGFADNDTNQSLTNPATFGGTSYAAGRVVEAEYRLQVSDGTNTYTLIGLNIREPNPTTGNSFGTTEGLAFVGDVPPVGVDLTVIDNSEGPGQTELPPGEYATPPCFTPGTMIETPDGLRAVEDLRKGDIVLTRDDGPQEICWSGAVRLNSGQLAGNPRFRPVLIKANALGPGMPARDMLVSRQHRILIEDWRAELLFGSCEVLAAAVDMIDDANILPLYDLEPVTYIHFMFDRHQIVRANGLWAESLRPGPAVLATLGRSAQEELFALFPELRAADRPPFDAARPLLRAWEARVLNTAA